MHGYVPVRCRNDESATVAQRGAPAVFTAKGLKLPNQMAFDRWVEVGSYLSRVVSSSAWCLGDWLVYGESAFSGRYRDAIELTSLNYQTLRNHAWVARRFPMDLRRDTLSFTHHVEVAALAEAERDFWLRKAEQYGWSVKRLRREVKASLLERVTENEDNDREAGDAQSDQAVTLPPKDTTLLTVPISADRLESCRLAANRIGLDVETWAGEILLRAATAHSTNSDDAR